MMAIALVVSAVPIAQAAGVDDNAGRALFVSKGCFECHGYVAQGSLMTGPSLAPNTPSLDAMRAYVRAPKRLMPPYSEKILSDDDLSRIHAYLISLPEPRSPAGIALLAADAGGLKATEGTTIAEAARSAIPSAAELTHGQAVFAAHCAACHGAEGSGGVGPSLRGIGVRMGIAAIEAQVRSPSGAMPALFPTVISATDVRDASRYVATLK
ncbi:c-type cytochrome [Paraburkholderia megapolitana]|uniref:c-type cytochrome n=1 Tax=Paraburkholderia megapolitana TaxID=420953 RepID=UPI0038BD169B